MPELGLFETIYSQRAIRRFKPEPVPGEVIERVIEAATYAPSGGNRQPRAFVVVTDSDKEAAHRGVVPRRVGGDVRVRSVAPAECRVPVRGVPGGAHGRDACARLPLHLRGRGPLAVLPDRLVDLPRDAEPHARRRLRWASARSSPRST